jgi:hypothetical protein
VRERLATSPAGDAACREWRWSKIHSRTGS